LFAAIEVEVTRLIELEDVWTIGEEVAGLEKRLSRFPAARVRRTDLAARLEARMEAPTRKAMKDEVTGAVKKARRRLREFVNAEIAKMPPPNRKAKFLKRLGYEWEEIFGRYINPNTMLKEFGEEPVEPHIVDRHFDDHSGYNESGTCATSPEEDGTCAPSPEEEALLDELSDEGSPSAPGGASLDSANGEGERAGEHQCDDDNFPELPRGLDRRRSNAAQERDN
jgi:hypothetical protein